MTDTTVSRTTAEERPPTGVVEVGGAPLTVDDVVAVARHGAPVRLNPAALRAMADQRVFVEGLADDDRPHYGISTGFGALHGTRIPPERRRELQANLVRSHAAGTGAEVETEVVRALMLRRLATLATGHTGVRPAVAELYRGMLEAGITPVVREHGSLGCSGDLAPLAHVALAAMGEGEVVDAHGARRPAGEALRAAGLEPVVLAEKEGLALINGTDGMVGMLALAISDLRRLLATADVAAGLSVDGLRGSNLPFFADVVEMRPHPGQAATAANLRALLAGSAVVASAAAALDGADDAGGDGGGVPAPLRVQDAYSLRCAPQVHGAARDTLEHAELVASRELAAVIDNPVITRTGRLASNGNFHGAPVAYVLDFLAIAVADVASISERRTDRFLDRHRSDGLPPFLAHDPGVDSGLMIAQYTAAGIVSELKRLAVPASVDSIPTSAMQEDHVSMGWAAARKLRRAVDCLERVLAVEILTACRGLALRGGSTAPGVAAVLALVHGTVPGPGPDRYLAPEIDAVAALVRDGAIVATAADAVGQIL
ncbi:histidine ammonia-lyase [Puerhibacterium puerhi]|uniref:histidine ammonia-lyase n=1 Tax=Puerhibacterium puerhi TaxID=2692623 RepID=UPI0013580CE2|nr:histidine ammonia-lyase [Puerhibacterium puerhi]